MNTVPPSRIEMLRRKYPLTTLSIPAAVPQGKYLVATCVVSFGLIFLEILLFQMMVYVSHYLNALTIIPIALLGVSLGGLAAFYLKRRGSVVLTLAALLFPVSILISLLGVACLPLGDARQPYVLMFPFFLSAVVVTLTFVLAPAHRVYLVHLLGAAAGVLSIGYILRHLGEENSPFLLAGLMLCGCFPLLRTIRFLRLRRAIQGGVLLLIVFLAGLIFVNRDLRYVNLPYLILACSDADHKIFGHMRYYDRAEILHSATSLVGRVDILRYYEDGTHKRTKTYDQGVRIDTLRDRPQEVYDYDPRLPKGFLKDPDVLIIGTAGEGVTKTAKNLGKGEVTGVEINPAMVELMTNHMAEFTHHAYDGIEIHVIDGRSFVRQTSRKFDIITLLNTYAGYGLQPGKEALPDYLHTVEAIRDYLDHLSDRGFLMFEEVVHTPDRTSTYAIMKLLHTIFTALEATGVEDPTQHLFIYQWKQYVQIIVKKQSLTQEDDAFLVTWMKKTSNTKNPAFFIRKKSLIYSPFHPQKGEFARFIRAEDKASFYPHLTLSPNTDEHPFSFDVYPERWEVKSVFYRITILAFVLSLLPAIVVFTVKFPGRRVASIPYMACFGLLGIGYLLVEIVLIQKSQIYVGSPGYALAGVLGTMLFCSGVGGWCTSRLKGRGIFLAFALIMFLLLGAQGALGAVFAATASFPLPTRIGLTFLLIAPLAFLMGMPFPFALESCKRRFSAEYAALMLAVNGGFSAMATPLAILSSVMWGFSATFLLGTAAYGLVAAMFLIGRFTWK